MDEENKVTENTENNEDVDLFGSEESDSDNDLSFLLADNKEQGETESQEKDEGESQETESTSPDPTPEPAPAPTLEAEPVKPSVSPDIAALTDSISKLVEKKAEAPQVTQPAKQYTKEEIDKLTGRFVISKEIAETMGFIDPTPVQLAALQTFADSVSKHGYMLSSIAQRAELEKIAKAFEDRFNNVEQRLAPVQSIYEKQQIESLANKFYTDYPDLKGYESIVDTVAASLVPDVKSGTIQFTDAVKKTAEHARSIVKQFAGAQAPAQANHSAPVRQMNQIETGGRSQQGTTSRAHEMPDWL